MRDTCLVLVYAACMMTWIGLLSSLPVFAAPQLMEVPVAVAFVRTESCGGPARKVFDFWLGEWEVYTPDGQLAGTNTITLEEGGCLIKERWTGADGSSGQSFNFYDPAKQLWRQVWISSSAVIDYAGNPIPGGGMRLEGAIRYQKTGSVHPFRGTWTQNEDGSVRQHLEQADPQTGSWSDWFIGTYVRRAASSEEKPG